jgi:MSHA biogenesis protein MshM|tara:strand:- start:467 stop:1387 length:921 start_codon:yes stop_codon:yes gene_type:complete
MTVGNMIGGFKAYYGLNEQPFSLAPNTEFYVDLKSQQECFNVLNYALETGEGFIKVTGEVGTGKTMLCRRLLNSFTENQVSVYIPNPSLSPQALWRAIAHELRIDVNRVDLFQIQERIQEKLLQLALDNKTVILVIDEAQCLPEDSLEAMRLISNLEMESRSLIQIVLFGQPELNEILATERFRQLKQRISYSAELKAMDENSLQYYIQQRMIFAGYRGMPIFDDKALKLMAKVTSGVPRLINIIAQKAMFSAFGGGASQVSVAHVQAAAADTEGAVKTLNYNSYYWREIFLLILVIVLVAINELS